jgi:hypothetical protein
MIALDMEGVKEYYKPHPLFPFSKLEDHRHPVLFVWRGGEITKRGLRPLLNYSPLRFTNNKWKGVRGIGFN